MKLYVYYFNEYVANLIKDSDGYSFAYTSSYLNKFDATPIAYSFPLRHEVYFSEGLFPFFQSLLSEGWLKRLQQRVLKIDENDLFSLLAECGGETMGAVSIYKEKQ